jgi:hypothetical protein
MKRTKLIAALVLGLVLGLTLSAAMGVYAQGGGDRQGEGDSQGVGGEGLTDPPPAGMSVLYTFTGARHETIAGSRVATVVHCTNYGTQDASVRVEIYEYNDLADRTFSGEDVVDSNHTATFSTQDTLIYDEDVIMTQPIGNNINQGSGRVMSDLRTVICTAQVVDPAHNLPYFMINLDLYRN